MKTESTPSFFLLSFAVALFLLLPGSIFAQQKTENQAKAQKTYTIHVTKEVDGNITVIDTTVVTDGEFDADAFLEEKGVMNDAPEAGKNVEKQIIIRHPGSQDFTWNELDGNSPDTISINDKQVFILKDNHDLLAPPREDMPFDFNFNMPREFHHMEGPHFEDMMEGMLKTMGLENVMPFGEMKQVVVKKKRNGKKVIITFEDRDGEESDQGNKKEEKVIIYKNGDQGMAPQNEKYIIIKGDKGEKVIVNGEKVMINEDTDKTSPLKKEIRVTVIEEDKK